jgi:DNA invertase Pin-like site-specific DNA recombinase
MKEHALLSGDTLIIKELDRLGRNKQLIKEELEDLRKKGIRVVILNIPTTKMLLSEELSGQSLILEMINNILIEVLSTIAEEERIKIRKRQAEGIALAKERGVKLGRPQRLKRGDRLKEILRQVNNKEKTVVLATKELNISRTHF